MKTLINVDIDKLESEYKELTKSVNKIIDKSTSLENKFIKSFSILKINYYENVIFFLCQNEPTLRERFATIWEDYSERDNFIVLTKDGITVDEKIKKQLNEKDNE